MGNQFVVEAVITSLKHICLISLGNVNDGFHLMGDHLKALVLLKYVDFSTSMMVAKVLRKGL